MYSRDGSKQDEASITSAADKEDSGSTTSERVSGYGTPTDRLAGARRSESAFGMSSSSSVPSIRSRVTVVCAECKKQKLKCDRRIPCESCTKRNTVSRCIYTPAAIEKVDVTSINNRLRVVEGNLSAALGAPVSTYPPHLQIPLHFAMNPQLYTRHVQNSLHEPANSLAGFQIPSFTINPHPHRGSHSSVMTQDIGLSLRTPRILALADDARAASTAAPLDSVPSLWTREVAVDSGVECHFSTLQQEQNSRDHIGGNMVSSKRLKMDLRPIDRDSTITAQAFGFGRFSGLDTNQSLSLHAGLGLPPSSSEQHDTQLNEIDTEHGSSSNPNELASNSDIYASLATHLLSQFPSQPARSAMLQRLGEANLSEGMSCVPFHVFCADVESICSGTNGNSKQVTNNSTKSIPEFSKIAEAAVGLAVGALIWATEPSSAGNAESGESGIHIVNENQSVSRTFAYDAYSFGARPSGSSSATYARPQVRGEEAKARPDPTEAYALYRLAHLSLAMHTSRHGHAARDPSFIHAYTLSVHYLLLAQSTSSECSDAILPAELPALVGALVWEARVMGLGVDPDEFDDNPNEQIEGLATSMDRIKDSVKYEERPGKHKSRITGKKMSIFVKEVRRRLWWSVVWIDLLVSDTFGYNATILPGEYSTRLPANVDDSCFHPDSDVLPPPDDSDPQRNNTFYILKLQLLEIGKHAPLRAFRSGLVPTLGDPDSAATAGAQRLADEIMQWLDDLPDHFRLDHKSEEPPSVPSSPPPMTPLLPPQVAESDSKKHAAEGISTVQRCDLAFHAYHTIMRLFTPGPTSPMTGQHHSSSWPWNKTMIPSRQFVALKAIEPALALVHAAQMQLTYAPNAPSGTYHMYIFPRRLFDAAVVLAYVAIQQPLFIAPVVIESIKIALDILKHVLRRGPSRGDANCGQKPEAEWIIETLLKRAEEARACSAPIMAGVKRKHDDVEVGEYPFMGTFRFPFLGSGIMNSYMPSVKRSTSNKRVDVVTVTGTSSSQRTPSMFMKSSSSVQPDNSLMSDPVDMAFCGQEDLPTGSVRQRISSLEHDKTANAAHVGLVPVVCNSEIPPAPYLRNQTHSTYDLRHRLGQTSSPFSHWTPEESLSHSRIPQLPSYGHIGRSGDASDRAFLKTEFQMPQAMPPPALPPFPTSPTYYPLSSYSPLSYTATSPLHNQQTYQLSMTRDSSQAGSRLNARDSPGMVSFGQADTKNVADTGEPLGRTGPFLSFHGQRQETMNTISHIPAQQFPQQNQPIPWNNDGQANSDASIRSWPPSQMDQQ